MLKLKKLNFYAFARSRIRREIQFDPKLKDFSATQEVKLQIEKMRDDFEAEPTKKFSDIIENPQPKLGTRFAIDQKKLSQVLKP